MPKGTSRWAQQSSGPDWTDVASGLRAIQDLNGCTASLMVLPSGGLNVGSLDISLMATKPAPTGGEPPISIVLSATWPNRLGYSVEMCCMKLIYQVDKTILDEWYTQEKIEG